MTGPEGTTVSRHGQCPWGDYFAEGKQVSVVHVTWGHKGTRWFYPGCPAFFNDVLIKLGVQIPATPDHRTVVWLWLGGY